MAGRNDGGRLNHRRSQVVRVLSQSKARARGLSKGLRGVALDITPLKESRDLSLLFSGQAVTSGPRFGNFESGALAAATSTEFSIVSGGLAAFAGAALVGLAIPAFMRYDAFAEPDPDETERRDQLTSIAVGAAPPADHALNAADEAQSAAVGKR